MLTWKADQDCQYVDFAIKFKEIKAITPESSMFDEYGLEVYQVSFAIFHGFIKFCKNIILEL